MSHTQEFLMSILSQVIDPEVGLNIVDMGLVYGVELTGESVRVEMTLTTPGCPMKDYMTGEVTRVLEALEGITEVKVDIVWVPAWSPDKIKPGALEDLRNGSY